MIASCGRRQSDTTAADAQPGARPRPRLRRATPWRSRRRLSPAARLTLAWLGWLAGASAAPASSPWLTNQPIVTVARQLYRQNTMSSAGVWTNQYMAGPGWQRIEVIGEEATDDVATNVRERFSTDNGQTWSAYQTLPDSIVNYAGVPVWEGGDTQMPTYDAQAAVLIQPWLRQIQIGSVYHNFTYYRLSSDYGHTWSAPKQLKYEAGADFDPANPLNPAFLNHNEAYFGQKFTVMADGSLSFAVGHANDPGDPQNDARPWRMGAVNFNGHWNPQTHDFDWTSGQRMAIAPTVSSRGLMEPDVIQLKDGRLLDVFRGSNASISAEGHKWFSLSSDGGLTMSPVTQWKYDDGSSFFSPSSIHRLFRSETNGKLYWIGNITPTNPNGNSPRHPLVIAEVDEQLVALRKSTVTTIADQEAGQLNTVQFSNFSLLENPQTHQIELYMSDIAAKSNVFDYDSYKYTLTLLPAHAAADVNGDGTVDLADYDVLRSHWRQTVAPQVSNGDMNVDGTVNLTDFLLFKRHYIEDTGGAGADLAVPVPEPGGRVMAGVAAVIACVVRRRIHHQR